MHKYVPMGDFVREIETFASCGLPSDEVHAFLEETLVEPATLDPYVRYRADRYTRNLVHKGELFELLVICWKPGQAAPIHGHEGERCWARVERGRLRFSNYRELSEKPLALELVGDPVDGDIGYLDGPADIHAVENVKAFGGPAASLHLYSRPYAECDIYDLERSEKRRVKLAYDTLFGKPAAVS